MHAVDAELVGDVVEVGVVGTLDGRVEVDPAIAAVVPVAVLVVEVGQLEIARIEDPRGRRDGAGIQPGDGHHRLDGRARRVEAAQRTVEQRPVDGITQFGVLRRADAVDEQVGVEARVADHRQHLAGVRVQRHHGAAAIAQGLLGGDLQVHVQAQHDVLPGHRRNLLQHPHDAALGVGFHFLVAYMTMQLRFIEVLDAGLADVLGTAVLGAVEAGGLALVDPPDEADRVGEMLAVRVVTDEFGIHIDARQLVAIDLDEGDLLLAQLMQQGDRFEGVAALLQGLVALQALLGAQVKNIGDLIEHRHRVAGALAGQGEVEAGQVLGQHLAIAVEDQPALRGNRQHVDTVVLGDGGVGRVVGDLEEVHPRHQGHAHQGHQQAASDQPAVDQRRFLLVVLEFDRIVHREIPEGPHRSCGKAVQPRRARGLSDRCGLFAAQLDGRSRQHLAWCNHASSGMPARHGTRPTGRILTGSRGVALAILQSSPVSGALAPGPTLSLALAGERGCAGMGFPAEDGCS